MTKHCGGKSCDIPCRLVQDCMLRTVPSNEQRRHYLPKILKLLEAGPATRDAIAETLGLSSETAANYLRHLHREKREIRRVQHRPGFSAVLWELGTDPTLGTEDEADGGTKQHTVAARQIGMRPDPLALPVEFFKTMTRG